MANQQVIPPEALEQVTGGDMRSWWQSLDARHKAEYAGEASFWGPVAVGAGLLFKKHPVAGAMSVVTGVAARGLVRAGVYSAYKDTLPTR